MPFPPGRCGTLGLWSRAINVTSRGARAPPAAKRSRSVARTQWRFLAKA